MNLYMLLLLRCTTFIGVCVEFVAAIAWLAEPLPDKKRKELVLGWTQAFSSIGGLLVAWANQLSVQYAERLPAIQLPGFLTGLGEISDPHAACALYFDERNYSGYPFDYHSPVFTRIAGVGPQTRDRTTQTT